MGAIMKNRKTKDRKKLIMPVFIMCGCGILRGTNHSSGRIMRIKGVGSFSLGGEAQSVVAG